MGETPGASKGIQARSDPRMSDYEDLVIPELEEAPLYIRNYPWTAREDAILRKYYPIRSLEVLVKYFSATDTPRTKSAIRSRAHVLGLTTPRIPWKR